MNWKLLAIIFIIISVLEFSLIIYFGVIGTKMIEDETVCAYNICADYDAYQYDPYERMCYCYRGNELEHSEYIK